MRASATVVSMDGGEKVWNEGGMQDRVRVRVWDWEIGDWEIGLQMLM